MSSIRIRPRFKISSSLSPEEVIEKIEVSLKREETNFYAESMLANFIVVRIKPSERKIWSPQISLSIDKQENGCIIRGLYGPRPTLWTMFIFLYIGIGVAVLFALLYGLARLNLNLDASVLWLIPALLAFALILYIFAQAGQKFSAQQMFDLHHFIEKALDRKIKIY
ncbi:MAG: hypothetical protein U0W24_14315 [Bacteroidales bacterium]